MIFAHLYGLSILGLAGSWVGRMSKNKDHKFANGFLVGFLMPVLVGLLSVLLKFYFGDDSGAIICGGSASLGVALLVPVFYSRW